MARGAARARCRVPDPLRIDSHTVPSQRTCHVGWRRTREVRRKLRVVRPPRPPPLPRRAPPSPPPHGSPPPLSSGIRRALSKRGDIAQEAVALRGLALAPPLGSRDPGDREARPSPKAGPLRHLHRALLSLKIIVDQLVNRPLPWWAQSHWILKFHSCEYIHSPIRTSLSGTPSEYPAPPGDQTCSPTF